MLFTPSLLVLLASAGLLEARSMHLHQHEMRHAHGVAHSLNRRADSTVLSPQAVQSGSFLDGSTEIGAAEVGQAKSHTSTNNFINNCAGKTLTNGLQITTGSCNGITMGDIPAKTNMISAIITFPLPGSATIQSDTTFNISVQISNLVAGVFTNPDATYYTAPQFLQGGLVVGHTHVTVQDMGSSLNPQVALDATQFAFFKGINDAGNGKGLLSATVTGGLPAGNYRVCTIVASSNHQPALMPVAQRGTCDDCTKFTVIGSGTTINVAANNGAKGIAAAALAKSAVDAGVGFVVSATSSAAGNGTATSVVKAGNTKATSSNIKAATTTSKAGNGTATSVVKAGNTKATSKDIKAATTSKAGKGATTSVSKAVNTKATSSDIKAATTISKAGKGTTTSVAKAGNTKAAKSTSAVAVVTGAKSGSGSSSSGSTTQIITIIKTFFVFSSGKGGSCPEVSKSGGQFNVLGELFTELADAAAAACGHQFTACVSFSGAGFSESECISQKDSCAAVASTQSNTATAPATVTASIVIPASTTLSSTPGSVIAVQTMAASSTAAAVGGGGAKAVNTDSSSPAESFCSIVTGTITVDAPAPTQPVALATTSAAESVCSIVTGTVTVDAPAQTATASSLPAAQASPTSSATPSSKAIGGISAPAIVNTGDATRPFSVNGNTFVNKSAAVQRSCDVQFNACANAVNGQKLPGVTIADCSQQQTTCGAQ